MIEKANLFGMDDYVDRDVSCGPSPTDIPESESSRPVIPSGDWRFLPHGGDAENGKSFKAFKETVDELTAGTLHTGTRCGAILWTKDGAYHVDSVAREGGVLRIKIRDGLKTETRYVQI